MKLGKIFPGCLLITLGAMAFYSCENLHGENNASQPKKVATESELPSTPKVEPSKEETFDFTVGYLMGQFDPAAHPDFVKVDDKYTDGDTYHLRKDTYAAFQKMWEAAMADGIKLVIISATRNFDRQKMIWEAKWTGARKIENGANAAEKYPDPVTRALKILEYSSMPGTSRHHWGTDVDLNDLDNYTFEMGPGKPVYEWLSQNASIFGFCQPYSAKGPERPEGYNEEKWHWSYMPVSEPLTKFAADNLKNEMISGFAGSETAVQIGVVKKYVLGVNPVCRK